MKKEIFDLRDELNKAKREQSLLQEEITSYQRTIMQLTRDLDATKSKDEHIENLKRAIEFRDKKIEE